MKLLRWGVSFSSGLIAVAALAQIVDPYYAGQYQLTSLGSVPGVPLNYGGLTLKRGTTDRLLIGGAANSSVGAIYEIQVVRGAGGHITGFTGTATVHANGTYNDGGLCYAPGTGVLFASMWPVNQLQQFKEGSVNPDKVIDLTALGVAPSHSALNFVPSDYPAAAGRVKLICYGGGQFYDAAIVPDGLGTYFLTGLNYIGDYQGGPEGFIYVPAGSPLFTNGLLLSEYGAGVVAAYEVDPNGNPIASTRRPFISGLSGAEGAFVDPVTGDFLFSTFGGFNQVVVVTGFAAPQILNGTVEVGEYGAPLNTVSGVVEVRNLGNPTPIESHPVQLTVDGTFAVQTNVQSGNYDVAFKGSHWLRDTTSPVAFTATGASAAFSIINGDIDEDNEVGIGDYAILSFSYGSVPGDGNWNPAADLEGDGEVSIGDYAILSANYGLAGDD
ncbi:MAG: hypothetical protein K1X67_03920 [Fimbriimonadaceae bacterium]|nr:hypothetical protein [Fimbriimonadaceae bacterium]